MKVFNVPADFKHETIDRYRELNEQEKGIVVNETYGQLTNGYLINSGRIKTLLPEIDIKKLEKYVDYSLKNGIKFNNTLNPACLGNAEFTREGIKELMHLLKDLNSIGIKDLTITLPAIIEFVQMSDLEFDLKVSAINHVDSITKLDFYKKMGVKRVVIEPDLYRNFRTLRDMVQYFGDGVEIIVNDLCYKNCPYKIFHYNHEAHGNNPERYVNNYYFMRCGIQKSGDFSNYLKLNWIRPEDIKLYENMGIQNFKIQGRPYIGKGNIMKVLAAYAQEKFDGNLLELLHLFAPYDSVHQPYIDNKGLEGFVEGFYYGKVNCSNICDSCGYCKKYAQKSIKDSTEKLKSAIHYYHSQDQFKKLVNTL